MEEALRNSFLRQADKLMRRLGVTNAFLYALSRGLARYSGGRCRIVKYYFVAQPVAPSVSALDAGAISIAPVSPDDRIVKQFPRSADVINRRFRDGAICLVARNGDEFAGYLWLKLRGYEEDEVRCHYIPTPELSTAWDFDIYVAPSYRMGRTFMRLWSAANEFLRRHEIDWTLSRISAYNVASLYSHRRMGSRQIAAGLFLCLGMVQIALISIWPFVHVSLRDNSRPVLRLKPPAQRAEQKNAGPTR